VHYAVLLQLHVLQLETAHLRRGDREGEGQGGRRTGREEDREEGANGSGEGRGRKEEGWIDGRVEVEVKRLRKRVMCGRQEKGQSTFCNG
jgi:hypothetical protein